MSPTFFFKKSTCTQAEIKQQGFKTITKTISVLKVVIEDYYFS